MDTYRACPFCKSEITITAVYPVGKYGRTVQVKCLGCGVSLRIKPELWNARPREDALALAVLSLEEVVDKAESLLSAIKMARTTAVQNGYYDSDIYYNHSDFGKAEVELAEIIREMRKLQKGE